MKSLTGIPFKLDHCPSLLLLYFSPISPVPQQKGVKNRADRQAKEVGVRVRGWPGQRQEIPMQHELFSSIVPPEQLFVTSPPLPVQLYWASVSDNRPPPLYEATAPPPAPLEKEKKKKAQTSVTHTCMQLTHGLLLSRAWDWGEDQKLGVPLHLSPESHCG